MKIDVPRRPMADTGSAGSDKNGEFAQQLKVEFRDLASDQLSKAEALLGDGGNAGELGGTKSDSIYRKAHGLRGLAASCGYSLNSVVAHRAEESLADEKVLKERISATSRNSSTRSAIWSAAR